MPFWFWFCFQLVIFSFPFSKITPNLGQGAPPSVSFRLKRQDRSKERAKITPFRENILLYDKNAKQKSDISEDSFVVQMLHGTQRNGDILSHSLIFHKFLLLYLFLKGKITLHMCVNTVLDCKRFLGLW